MFGSRAQSPVLVRIPAGEMTCTRCSGAGRGCTTCCGLGTVVAPLRHDPRKFGLAALRRMFGVDMPGAAIERRWGGLG